MKTSGVWLGMEDDGARRRLLDAGYVMDQRAVRVERSLDGLSALDPFRHVRLAELGWTRFTSLLGRALAGSGCRSTPADPDRFLARLRAEVGAEVDPRLWSVAYLGEVAAGVLMPQLYPADPRRGTMAFLGVLPGMRGRGVGRRLHAVGLARLAAAGARRYTDMTDVLNLPMLRVFAANGCRLVGLREHYQAGESRT